MKFAALLKKELRICLPWLLLCIVIMVVLSALIMRVSIINQQHYANQGYYNDASWYSTPYSPLQPFGPLLLIFSLAFGIVLGIVQFFLPGLTKTWAFTIHRSIRPQMVIWAKFAAAIITFVASLGLIWTLIYAYASVPGRFSMPVFFRIYLDGWMYILAGLIAYWGTALSAVSTTRLYTTRLLGLAIATLIVFRILFIASITQAFWFAAIGSIILIIQLFYTFLTREY